MKRFEVVKQVLVMVRRSWTQLLAGLGMVGVSAFLVIFLVNAVAALNTYGPGSTERAQVAVALLLIDVAAIGVCAVGIFVVGLVVILAQSARSGECSALGAAFAAFRHTGPLLMIGAGAALVAALAVFDAVLAGQSTAAAAFAIVSPVVLPIACCLLLFAVYTALLIVDRRLTVGAAIGRSVRLVRAGGVLRHLVLVVLMGAGVAGLWWAALRFEHLPNNGEGSLSSLARWTWQDEYFEATFDSLVLHAALQALFIALTTAVSVAVIAVGIAAMYAVATKVALQADEQGEPAVVPASAPGVRVGRPLTMVFACWAVLAAASGLFWWLDYAPSRWHELPSGTSVTLLNGLSLTMPAETRLASYSGAYRRYPEWCQRLGVKEYGLGGAPMFFPHALESAFADGHMVDLGLVLGTREGPLKLYCISLSSASSDPRQWSSAPPVALTSPDGATQLLWKPGSSEFFVVTHIAGRPTGLLYVQGSSTLGSMLTIAQARRAVERLWADYSIQGAQAPTVAHPGITSPGS